MKQIFLASKIATLLSLAVASVLIRTSSACSPVPGHQFATLEEQVQYASSIFEGRVKRVIEIIPNNTYAILLEDYTIIRSGHYGQSSSSKEKPSYLEINGFNGQSLCGPAPPKKGSKVIVFVCPNQNKSSWQTGSSRSKWRMKYWSLNRIAIGAGVVSASSSNRRKVRQLAERLESMPASRECGSRPPSQQNRNQRNRGTFVSGPIPS